MKRKLSFIISSFILLLSYYLYTNWEPGYQAAIKFFTIDKNINFVDLGSVLEIYKKNDQYIIAADSWSKTNKKVYLRQDVNLLFKNGKLIGKTYPWKENADWMINKIKVPLAKDNSIYTLLSLHHAEIHDDEQITSRQSVTSDKLYVTYFQNILEAFKVPQNAREEDTKKKLDEIYRYQRNTILETGIKELNINQSNYEIYDLDTFSLRKNVSKIIPDEQWESVLGRLWEGLYRNYVLDFPEEEIEYFNPPMPWVLLDKSGTHLLVLIQHSDGSFEKLLMQL